MEIGLILFQKLEQVAKNKNHNQNYVVCYKTVNKTNSKR